jgi:hypothetical protein
MEARLKAVALTIIAGFLLFANFAHARCSGEGFKCFTLDRAVNAAASPEEARRLRENIMKIGLDEILQSCKPGPDTEVTELFGTLCGPGVTSSRVCKYTSTLGCNYQGKSFDMKVEGSCKGALRDCGTFDSCARDNTVSSRTTGSFRGEGDLVPKGRSTSQKGAR